MSLCELWFSSIITEAKEAMTYCSTRGCVGWIPNQRWRLDFGLGAFLNWTWKSLTQQLQDFSISNIKSLQRVRTKTQMMYSVYIHLSKRKIMVLLGWLVQKCVWPEGQHVKAVYLLFQANSHFLTWSKFFFCAVRKYSQCFVMVDGLPVFSVCAPWPILGKWGLWPGESTAQKLSTNSSRAHVS